MTSSKQTLSNYDLKRLKPYPSAYMHTETVSATGGTYFRREMAFTRTREASSRVPAAVQRQQSIVGRVPDLRSDTQELRSARLAAVTPSAVQAFSPASPPPSAPLTFPDFLTRPWEAGLPWAVGKRSLSRRSANRPPATPPCSTTKPRGLGRAQRLQRGRKRRAGEEEE